MKILMLIALSLNLVSLAQAQGFSRPPSPARAKPPTGVFTESQSPGGYSYEDNKRTIQYWADEKCAPRKGVRVSAWHLEPVHYARFPGHGFDSGYTEVFQPVSASFRCR